MKIRLLIGSVLIFWGLASCEDPIETDKEEPTLETIWVNGANDALVQNPGDSLHFSMDFADNSALQKYRIRIEADFTALPHFTPFAYNEVTPLSGTAASVHTTVIIPDGTLAGRFNLVVEVMDMESNVSDPYAIPLLIETVDMPVISVVQPDLSHPLSAHAGDTFAMAGTIHDDEALEQIQLQLTQETAVGTQTFYFQTFAYDSLVYDVWSLDTLEKDSVPFHIPANATSGIYLLELSAFDTLGNYNRLRQDISVP